MSLQHLDDAPLASVRMSRQGYFVRAEPSLSDRACSRLARLRCFAGLIVDVGNAPEVHESFVGNEGNKGVSFLWELSSTKLEHC